MNSLPSDLDYNIMAGKAGSLGIRAGCDRWPRYLLYGNRGLFSSKTPLFFEFRGPRPGLKKTPFFEIGNDHDSCVPFGMVSCRTGMLVYKCHNQFHLTPNRPARDL